MDTTFFHKNLSKLEENYFLEYVQQKIPAIESLLTKFAEDATLLNISIEKFEKHDAFEVEYCLNLPAKRLVAKEASHTINKAVDLSKDRLLAQIKKYLSQLRKDRAHKSIRDHEVGAKLKQESSHTV